jgi:hypothetical protein
MTQHHIPEDGTLQYLKPEINLKIFINSVPTSHKRHSISITKTNQLLLFREIITVRYENHMKDIEPCSEMCNMHAGGT